MRDDQAMWQRGVVLVCTNQRPDGASKPSCGKARGEALRTWLKEKGKAEGGALREVRPLGTSCLGVCPHDGVAVAMVPGDRMVVVDPVADREALLDTVRAHFADDGAGRRGVLSRIKGRLGRS